MKNIVLHDNVVKANEIIGLDAVKALKRRGFEAEYVPNGAEALKRILEIIPEDASVGIPGTVTVRDIGALNALKARGNTVYQHWGPMSAEERRAARFRENSADVFLTSANAGSLALGVTIGPFRRTSHFLTFSKTSSGRL